MTEGCLILWSNLKDEYSNYFFILFILLLGNFMKAIIRPLRMKHQCISIELRAMRGCRSGAEGAGGGSLKSADCRPPTWRPAAAPQPGGPQIHSPSQSRHPDGQLRLLHHGRSVCLFFIVRSVGLLTTLAKTDRTNV